MSQQSRQSESGAVSLFVVIFSALLITVITVSFIRIMNQEQQAATTSDLSQSAYDSALAGVEDAKRVLLAAQQNDTMADQAIKAQQCDTINRAGVVGTTTTNGNSETLIQTNKEGGGSELNQAYTCVIIKMATDDYLAQLQADQSILVPLRSESPVSKIKISWLLQSKDAVDPEEAEIALGELTDNDLKLPNADSWSQSAPALIRAQVISPVIAPASDFSLDELNSSEATQTVFLYPMRVGSNDINLANFKRHTDLTTANSPQPIACSADNYAAGQYMCSTTLTLAQDIPANSQLAHLRLSALYSKSSVQIQLLSDSDNVVKFNGVQPLVDSTGRANDIFRRVESRLSVGLPDFQYPEASVDIHGNLCKDFFVTDENSGFTGASCKP